MSVPPILLSITAILAGLLAILVFLKLGTLTRTSLLTIARVGMVLIGPAVFLFGIIYLYFISQSGISPQAYAPYVRWPLLYLLAVINAWLIFSLAFGRKL